MYKRITKAFTLIELLVVIAIIGILTGFIFVSMNGAVNSAKDTKRQADLSSISKAILEYMAQNNNAYPYTASTSTCNLCNNDSCTNPCTGFYANIQPYLSNIPLDPDGSTYYTYTYSATPKFVLKTTLSNTSIYQYDSTSGFTTIAGYNPAGTTGKWNYSRAITVSNSNSTLTNYPISFTIDTAALIGVSKMNADGSDIRFSDAANANQLSYWIQSGINTSSTVIWVRALNLSNGSNTIKMYYGNASATAVQSRDNTLGTTNVALSKSATASYTSNGSPSSTVDGNAGTVWTADAPPQWIEIDLGSNALLNRLQFTVSQSPNGSTVHTVYGGTTANPSTVIASWSQYTSTNQVITYDFAAPTTTVRYVRVKTTTSPSWVSWFELVMQGTQLNTASQPTCSIGLEMQ